VNAPRSRRAIALPLVLLMLVLVAVVGYAYIDLTRARFGLSYKAVHYGRAYYLAEAGVQWAAWDVDRGGEGMVAPEALPAELSGMVNSYEYRLEVRTERLPGNRRGITSRATVGGVTVVLEAVRDLRALAVLRGRP
jgi:hypothetical protein